MVLAHPKSMLENNCWFFTMSTLRHSAMANIKLDGDYNLLLLYCNLSSN